MDILASIRLTDSNVITLTPEQYAAIEAYQRNLVSPPPEPLSETTKLLENLTDLIDAQVKAHNDDKSPPTTTENPSSGA